MKKKPVDLDLFGQPFSLAPVRPRQFYGDPRWDEPEPNEFGDFDDDDWETPGGTIDDLS